MSSTLLGAVRIVSTMSVAVAPGTGLNTYSVAVQPDTSTSYTTGTGANQAQRVAQVSGTATAAPADTNLATVVCVDGSVGFSHVREVIVFNDHASSDLLLDGSVANGWVAYQSGTAKITVPASSSIRLSKPKGTNGWTVDNTHKVVSLDPTAATIPYRVYVLGD